MCNSAAIFSCLPLSPNENLPESVVQCSRDAVACGVVLISGVVQRMGMENVHRICLAVATAVTAVTDLFMPLSSSEKS